MAYKPKPLDTSQVRLDAGLTNLTERLAVNTHETWAQKRFSEGWRYGLSRDDMAKEHPCLVPYDELPEIEKEYDRRTALETIRMLLALGYKIEAPHSASAAQPGDPTPGSRELDRLNALLAQRPRPHDLVAMWNARNPELWAQSVELFRLLGERVLKIGEPLLSYDVVNEGLKHFPDYVPLRQLLGLSLARSGASDAANAIMLSLYQEGRQDEETLGLLARTYKDLAETTRDPAQKKSYLRRAQEFYSKAYELTKGYWSGINSATLAVVLGDTGLASKVAGEVRTACLEELKRINDANKDPYWVLATLGEAALILSEWSEAEDWYSRAVESGQRRYGDLNSSRRNARLLMAHLNAPRERVEACFHIPAVVVFSGHMIDQPGRAVPRFPAQLEQAVGAEIRARLKKMEAGFGFSSAACGSDLMFLEAMLERDGEIVIVLPYEKTQFMEDSVSCVEWWEGRFENILARSADVVVASGQRAEGGILHEYANRMLYGLARGRAEQLETRVESLAVWNGQPGDGAGGTASAVELWRAGGDEVEIIDLAALLARNCPEIAGAKASEQAEAPRGNGSGDFAPEIRALLFADAVGFSKLSEYEVPLFVRHFLGLVGKLVQEFAPNPLIKNTWGDGLYFVFSDVRTAGRFALTLRDRVKATQWKEKGLPELDLRIGLHAGPVYACMDPVTERRNYIGAHVSRAARIEPVTPPGNVYASQPFAALASAEKDLEFRCEYVGQTAMAKKYGTFPTYVVKYRKASAAGPGTPSS
jgi:class 3 adenylate cyclase/tetratricopeptide (TPR) repeat protein